MHVKALAVIAAVAAIALVGLGVWFFLDSQRNDMDQMDPIVIAWSPFEHSALLFVAVDQDFFAKNGINASLRRYDSGAASLDGVLNSEADISVGVTEFPLVRKAFQDAGVRAMGSIDKGDIIYLVARKDRGIRNISDLQGKRIGTTIGTVAEFHLGRFLTLHRMTLQDITLVDVKTPEGWVNAVADGEIDAISTAQPYANAARDRLGDNAVVWPAQSSQPVFSLIVSTEGWILQHPELAGRVLKSLADAETYVSTHPAEAKAIVQQRLDLDPGYVDTIWQQNQFALTLDQSLVLAMEDEARWMIANNLTNATAVPDFRQYIYADGLESIRPGSVNIIQ